jgi:hypothetical protein
MALSQLVIGVVVDGYRELLFWVLNAVTKKTIHGISDLCSYLRSVIESQGQVEDLSAPDDPSSSKALS